MRIRLSAVDILFESENYERSERGSIKKLCIPIRCDRFCRVLKNSMHFVLLSEICTEGGGGREEKEEEGGKVLDINRDKWSEFSLRGEDEFLFHFITRSSYYAFLV